MRGFWRIASCIWRDAASACRAAWVGNQMAQLDRLDGDIDTLMARIAHIRTWTYITHRGDWIEAAADWQERARGIEDRLSDALHDQHHAALRRPPFGLSGAPSRGDGELLASVDKDGRGAGRGHLCRPARRLPLRAGRRRGRGDAHADHRRQPRVAQRGRGPGAAARRRADEAFAIDPARRDCCGAAARSAGWSRARSMLTPRVEVRAGDFLDGEARERVRQRLQLFVRGEIERRLAPLFAAAALPLDGAGARHGLSLLGGLARRVADRGYRGAGQIARPASRRALARLGVRFGTETIYVEPLLGREAVRFRALLWAVRHGRSAAGCSGRAQPRQGDRGRPGGPVIVLRRDRPARRWAAGPCGRTGWSGWRRRPRARARAGRLPPMTSWPRIAGIAPGELRRVLAGAGLSCGDRGGRGVLHRQGAPRACRNNGAGRAGAAVRANGNPFAKLKELRFA